MSERSDYHKPTKGKNGERFRGDEGGDWSKDWDDWDGAWDPKSKRASWPSAPPPPSSNEDFPALPARKDKQSQEDARSEENEETAGELPLKVPDASSSSSSHTKKKKWKVTPNHFLTGDELFNLLKEFVKTCAFDSYGAMNFCSEHNNKLLEYRYFSRAIYALNLPAACPVRVEQDDSKEDIAHIAYRVVMTLLEDGRIGHKEGGGWGFKKYMPSPTYTVQGFPIDGHGGALMRPLLQDSRANRFRLKEVNLLTIEMETEKDWGIVVASPIEHSYQLTLDGVKFRLKARLAPEVEPADWSPEENLEIVERFHRRIIGEDEEEPDLMFVKVKAKASGEGESFEIDFESMKDLEGDYISRVRGPFKSLLAKMQRLAWWELVRRWSPAEPGPSPLKLHKIFDQPASDEEKKEFESDVECMKICGMDSLRLAAAVSESADERERSTCDLSWECLDRKVQDTYLNEDLAAHLMALSGFIRMGTRQKVQKSHAAEMFFALFGAYKMESDMFAVVQLWDFFITDPHDPHGPPRPHSVKRLLRANEFTAAVPRFMGRTCSYMEFGEVYQNQMPWVKEDLPSKAKALRVRFEEYSDAYYRWNGSQAEESRPGTPGCEGWMPLTYDSVEGCFCSPSMKLPSGLPRPLPNKICAWMRGRSMKKLVSIKHSMETTPPYKFLREHLNEETKELWLIVDYKQHGEVWYKRDHHGGLGEEVYQDQANLLSFSENKKTLVSGVANGQALPRKVVTWLLESRNLSDLIPGRKRQVMDLKYEEGPSGQVSVMFVAPKDGQNVRLKAKEIEKSSKPVGYCGCLFEIFEDSEKPQVVSYSEDKKEWVFLAGTVHEEVIPWEAIAFIADKTSSEAGPRLTTPTSVRRFFPKASGTAVARIEQQTDHRFQTVKLLAEALTHCSAVNAAVQPCDQLAYVGMAAMMSFASETVMKADGRRGSSGWLSDVSFFNSHLVCTEGPVNHATFCAPRESLNWDTLVPEAQCQTEKDQPGSVKALRARLAACCNHVCYAASCFKSELHKNINMSSAELQEHIERVCRKYPKDNQHSRWPQLFKLGAPKAMGDVFLATIGAISLDSDHNEAKHLMKKHYQDSLDVYLAMGGDQAEELQYTVYSNRDLALWPSARIKEALRSTQKLKQQELALVPALQLEEGGELPDFASQCKDLQVIKVENYGELACSSPRSLYNSLILARKHQDGGDDSDENSEFVVEEEQDGKKFSETEGAIYCTPCQMYLNGPAQWADHEIGKKHRKAVHKMQAAKLPAEDLKPVEEKKAVVVVEQQSETIYCKYCDMLLNGPTQWADHERGKKHIKAKLGFTKEGGGKSSKDFDTDDSQQLSGAGLEMPIEMRQDLPPEPYPGAHQYPNALYENNPVSAFQEYAGSWYAPWGNPSEQLPPEDIPVPVEWQ